MYEFYFYASIDNTEYQCFSSLACILYFLCLDIQKRTSPLYWLENLIALRVHQSHHITFAFPLFFFFPIKICNGNLNGVLWFTRKLSHRGCFGLVGNELTKLIGLCRVYHGIPQFRFVMVGAIKRMHFC